METPLPNDSFKASNSPPVGGRLRSFSRDWQANNCSSNVLNIITNGYVLPFLSKPNLVRYPLIISEYKALPKDQALADCIQSLLSKNAIKRVENVKSLGFYSRLFLVPKPHQRWRPVIDLSRLNTFLPVEKFKMETPESIRTSLIPGEWVALIDLSDAYLHIPIHPHSRKYLRFCHRSQVFQFTSLGFYRTTQVKTCFDCKMFDVSNWVASLNGENGPRGTTLHETLSVSPQGALEISSTTGQPPSLDRSHFCIPRLVAEPCKRDERLRPSSQRPQYPTLYRRLKRRLGRSLRTKFYPRSVVSPGKRPSHKRPRIESCLSGPETLQGPVPGPNSASCNGQLNCGCLHKQTRGNTLSGDVCTPVENHDLVPSLSHNIESQAHSRVPECDGRPTFQVKSGTVDRMVTTSTGVQTDLPKVLHSLRGPICHSSEPQASTVRVSYPRPEGLGHRCSKHRLDGSHCLCLPSNGSPSQGDPKNQTMQLSDHTHSP